MFTKGDTLLFTGDNMAILFQINLACRQKRLEALSIFGSDKVVFNWNCYIKEVLA